MSVGCSLCCGAREPALLPPTPATSYKTWTGLTGLWNVLNTKYYGLQWTLYLFWWWLHSTSFSGKHAVPVTEKGQGNTTTTIFPHGMRRSCPPSYPPCSSADSSSGCFCPGIDKYPCLHCQNSLDLDQEESTLMWITINCIVKPWKWECLQIL